ncbi:MAG TPA: DegT/DnrJ/EryC1/StrS aminotransferase family protein [Candidatus Sulfotelmatobacter sp.]|nr:DegT/DnrJ/EryC1/StrS aminotransferase family protein [Candidatus Sulfotelmatobacter sp.]
MIKLIKSTFYKETQVKTSLKKFIQEAQQLSFGKECTTFEERFAKWHKRKYCILVNSGSSANLAIIQALLNLGKIKKGDQVGFSAITWSTNVMPLIQLGLKPIPIDIELDTLNISKKQLENFVKKYNIKMLFLTNLLGFCDDIDQIKAFCEEKKILLIEDNCESLGTVYKKKLLGNYGLASTFSFYVGHHMSTIEGGAICTDSSRLANMLRIVRAHGWDRNLDLSSQTKIRAKHKINSLFYSRYTFYDLGFNLRSTEINGFIGNKQLPYLNEIIKKRNKNFLKIAPLLYAQKDKFYPIRYNHIDLLSNFAIPIICKSVKLRDELVEKCINKIEIRPIVGGIVTEQPFFKKYISTNKFSLPNAEIVNKQGFYFGNNPELTNNEMKQIITLFT